jgi:hypothetical protein
LTAAAPYASLYLPPAALGNVPTSIRLQIFGSFNCKSYYIKNNYKGQVFLLFWRKKCSKKAALVGGFFKLNSKHQLH